MHQCNGLIYKRSKPPRSVNAAHKVATVIPSLNEVGNIGRCLQSLLDQTFPAKNHQIYVVDGGSNDGTKAVVEEFIAKSSSAGPSIKLLENPNKYTPHARNIALAEIPEDVEFIFEMIAHAYIPQDHIETRVEDFLNIEEIQGRKIAGVGTLVRPDGSSRGMFARWVESTLLSPLGNSGGQFSQFKGREKHHIPAFVIHRREALLSVDGWDERFHTNQDSDLSMRLRKNNWQLWRSDVSHVEMSKRQNISSFGKMCWRYGAWRMESLKIHPERGSIREMLPAIGVLVTLLLVLFAPEFMFIPIIAYMIVLFVDGMRGATVAKQPSLLLGLPLCLVILHTFFTLGFLSASFRRPLDIADR